MLTVSKNTHRDYLKMKSASEGPLASQIQRTLKDGDKLHRWGQRRRLLWREETLWALASRPGRTVFTWEAKCNPGTSGWEGPTPRRKFPLLKVLLRCGFCLEWQSWKIQPEISILLKKNSQVPPPLYPVLQSYLWRLYPTPTPIPSHVSGQWHKQGGAQKEGSSPLCSASKHPF